MRKILAPATGKVQWVGFSTNGNRLLSIKPEGGEAQTYEVAPVKDGYDLHNLTHTLNTGEFVCYHLRYWANGSYICDCPDATNRPERRCSCKHTRGLLAALRAKPF